MSKICFPHIVQTPFRYAQSLQYMPWICSCTNATRDCPSLTRKRPERSIPTTWFLHTTHFADPVGCHLFPRTHKGPLYVARWCIERRPSAEEGVRRRPFLLRKSFILVRYPPARLRRIASTGLPDILADDLVQLALAVLATSTPSRWAWRAFLEDPQGEHQSFQVNAEILEAGPRPGRQARRLPHISAGLGRRILRHAIPPLCSAQVCAIRPNLARPDQAHSRPAPHRPPRPQAASNVGLSLKDGHQGCPRCQVRANATGLARRRVPISASGASPRERKDAVWAGFEVAGSLGVLLACSARFSSFVSTRVRAQRSAKSAIFMHAGR